MGLSGGAPALKAGDGPLNGGQPQHANQKQSQKDVLEVVGPAQGDDAGKDNGQTEVADENTHAAAHNAPQGHADNRSEERRVGKEC